MEDEDIIPIPPESMDHNGSGTTSREDELAIAAAMGLDDHFVSPNIVPSSVYSSNSKASASIGSGGHKGGASSRVGVSLSSDFLAAGPSGAKTSSSSKTNNKKDIRFIVTNGTGRGTLEIVLAECETVETLKTLIHAQ
jgi:uncharacterized membrane protein